MFRIHNHAHRGLATQGSTVSTPVLRNSLAFRVSTTSPRVAAAAAMKASGTWSSSGSPRLRPQHFGNDIRVYEPSERCGHSSSSRENNSGL